MALKSAEKIKALWKRRDTLQAAESIQLLKAFLSFYLLGRDLLTGGL
jgi:hypothetical protein